CVCLMCVVTIALTGSRYGLLAAGIGLVLVVGSAALTRQPRARLGGLAMLLLACGGLFAAAQRTSYFAGLRFEELLDPLQVGSLRGRLDYLWIDALEYIKSSPWIGHGPAKSLFDQVYTDSEYLNVMKFYGAIGLIIYLAYYLWPLREMLKALVELRFWNGAL